MIFCDELPFASILVEHRERLGHGHLGDLGLLDGHLVLRLLLRAQGGRLRDGGVDLRDRIRPLPAFPRRRLITRSAFFESRRAIRPPCCEIGPDSFLCEARMNSISSFVLRSAENEQHLKLYGAFLRK